VAFGLTTEPSKVAFVKIDSSDKELAQNAAFDLGNEPRLLKGVMDGSDTVRVLVAQKGQGGEKGLNQALARVALELQPNVVQGTKVTLAAASNARVLPNASGGSVAITIRVGILEAR